MNPVASTFYYGVGSDINLYGIYASTGYISNTESFTPYWVFTVPATTSILLIVLSVKVMFFSLLKVFCKFNNDVSLLSLSNTLAASYAVAVIVPLYGVGHFKVFVFEYILY